MIFSSDELIALREHPPRMGKLAAHVRRTYFGEHVRVRGLSSVRQRDPLAAAEIERAGDWLACAAWPTSEQLRRGDHVVCVVDPDQARAWVDYLLALAAGGPGELALAPCSRAPAGTHRLWAIAAARLAMPAPVRIEARHDRIGIRVAQVALGFGADTLAGPIEPDRRLPVAGTTRPDENTRAGLFALVEQAGLTAVEAFA